MTVKKCKNCGGSDLQWHVSTVGPQDVQDGRIRMSEVSPIAYLACEECSETIYVAQEDEINRMLNLKPRGNLAWNHLYQS